MVEIPADPTTDHAVVAKRFLQAALELDYAKPEKRRMLFVPALFLAGQGLELMLKACVFLNGKVPPKNHDICGLWRRDDCEPVRGHVYLHAGHAVEEARENPSYLGVPDESEDILSLIEEYVIALGELHGGKGHTLRYPSEPEAQGPRRLFLVRALWGATDDLVRNPDSFRLERFLGRGFSRLS